MVTVERHIMSKQIVTTGFILWFCALPFPGNISKLQKSLKQLHCVPSESFGNFISII